MHEHFIPSLLLHPSIFPYQLLRGSFFFSVISIILFCVASVARCVCVCVALLRFESFFFSSHSGFRFQCYQYMNLNSIVPFFS